MKFFKAALLLVSLLLLSSCSDPYLTIRGDSQLMIEKDVHFLELYKNALCNIKDMHERQEISRGKCLAMYYDNTQNDRVKSEVATRASYILNNPDEFDKSLAEKLSNIATETTECTAYINANCM